MGGKTWSTREEEFFWTVMVPLSPKGVIVANRQKTWRECAELMQERLGREARREYNHYLLFEHYFQNVKIGHKSPKAATFVAQHKRDIEAEKARRADAGESDYDDSCTRPTKTRRRPAKKYSKRACAPDVRSDGTTGDIEAPFEDAIISFYCEPSFQGGSQMLGYNSSAVSSEVGLSASGDMTLGNLNSVGTQGLPPRFQAVTWPSIADLA